jgi:hypothetical protein
VAALGECPDQGAPDGSVVLHKQELCHDMNVPVSAVSRA